MITTIMTLTILAFWKKSTNLLFSAASEQKVGQNLSKRKAMYNVVILKPSQNKKGLTFVGMLIFWTFFLQQAAD